MKSKVIQVRDLEIIEKELNSAKIGVLACTDDKENVGQLVVPYLYSNKNIYFIIENEDDLNGILFEHKASFVIFRSMNSDSNFSDEKYFEVKCSGALKKVEEQRVIDEVIRTYAFKYSDGKEDNTASSDVKLIMIDTEEIQAAEIICY